MWKMVTEKGEKLPDLLVVLAITVVMAAVLLPAVTSSHGNEVNADSAKEQLERPIMDGLVGSGSSATVTRKDRYADPIEFEDTAYSPAIDDQPAPAETTLEAGLKEMRTTDISYQIP